MSTSRALALSALVAIGLTAVSRADDKNGLGSHIGLGQPISEGDVKPWDITILPDGTNLPPGSLVALSVAEPPRLRGLTSLGSGGDGRSVPFRIRGPRWQILYNMSYDGTCTLVVICSGPSATVTNLATGEVVDQFDLGEGDGKSRVVRSGPGIYQIDISPGSDTTRWQMKVDDYY